MHRRVQKESDELLCTVTRYGPQSVALAQVVKRTFDLCKISRKKGISLQINDVHVLIKHRHTHVHLGRSVLSFFFFVLVRQINF